MKKLCECGCGQATGITYRNIFYKTGAVANRFVRGHNISKIVGVKRMKRTVENAAYRQAKNRCTNPRCPKWKDYGERGIKFLFTSFLRFAVELGPRPTPQHSVDRINNDLHYQHGNVRWATKIQQSQNRRNVHV